MSYTRENRYVGYSNIAAGSVAGLENHCGAGNVPATPQVFNIGVGAAEPKNKENIAQGQVQPQWQK